MNTPQSNETHDVQNIHSNIRNCTTLAPAKSYEIDIFDADLAIQRVTIQDPIPTGRQILEQSSFSPVNKHILLMHKGPGNLTVVDLTETINIYEQGVERFFVFKSDRSYFAEINDARITWGEPVISEAALRFIGAIDHDETLWLEKRNSKDKLLLPEDSVNLQRTGLEKVYSQSQSWQLKVHGVDIVSQHPTIKASEALVKAGFNPADGWILVLKVKGQPRNEIQMNDIIDLRTPGIEKLRLTPAEINNGETVAHSQTTGCRSADFNLLAKDIAYLESRKVSWSTQIDTGRRWLMLFDVQLPNGYSHQQVNVAIEIPSNYPQAALDMFYCFPALTLSGGQRIAQTEAAVVIKGQNFQRWSRHLSGKTRWQPNVDSVITHLAVVEESLEREVE